MCMRVCCGCATTGSGALIVTEGACTCVIIGKTAAGGSAFWYVTCCGLELRLKLKLVVAGRGADCGAALWGAHVAIVGASAGKLTASVG